MSHEFQIVRRPGSGWNYWIYQRSSPDDKWITIEGRCVTNYLWSARLRLWFYRRELAEKNQPDEVVWEGK